MTALAFIFAINELDPASFYVLDEVDAALDKHNSGMFAQLVKKYSAKAQYVIISHNDQVITQASIGRAAAGVGGGSGCSAKTWASITSAALRYCDASQSSARCK